jgi:hypothetical protein
MNMHTIDTFCPICGEHEAIQVPASAYMDWQMGSLIQHAMPMLTATQREQVITGICAVCWEDSFGED